MDKPLRIAVVPARGGSKRIPRKNIREFRGRPLIGWPLEILGATNLFDLVVVSTDDREIADVARSFGASVPFVRDASLADDITPTAPVVFDAVDRVASATGRAIGEICVVYPSAVFVDTHDLLTSRELLLEMRAEVVMSATRFPSPIERAWRRSADGTAQMIWPENRLVRTQDLSPSFLDAGQFYWWQSGARERILTGVARTVIYELPHVGVRDIDTEDDWRLAEALLNSMQ